MNLACGRTRIAAAGVILGLLFGCGKRESPAPSVPVGDPAPTSANDPRPKTAPAKAEGDPIEKLLHELAVARQPGIYFTLKKLEKPELQPHLAKAHADERQRARIARAI